MTELRNVLKAGEPKETEERDEDGIQDADADEVVSFGGNAEPLSEEEYEALEAEEGDE